MTAPKLAAPQTPITSQEEMEDAFRKTLEDVQDFAEAMKKHCNGIDELIELAKHAQADPVVMRMVLSEMTKPSWKK